MLTANSGAEVGVVGDGEFNGNNDAPVVVKTVQVGAKRAAGVIVVVGRRGSGIGTIIRAATRVVVGRGERHQRSLSDPGSSRQQTGGG